VTTHETETIPPIEDTGGSWAAMLHDWALYQWRRLHRGEEPGEWPPPWALPALSIAALVVVVAVIAGLIVPLVAAIGRFLAGAFADGAGWLHDWSIARVVLDPVRAWLTGHVGGLPVDADTLWWTWSITGGVLLLLALLTTTAGRIGWVLYGVATVAMVYAATTGPARPTAAGITALWWLVLSLPALHRGRRTPRVYAYLPQLPTLAAVLRSRPAATED
jgi:hypothetical protein